MHKSYYHFITIGAGYSKIGSMYIDWVISTGGKAVFDFYGTIARRRVMYSVTVKANAVMDILVKKKVLEDGDEYTEERNTNYNERTTRTVSAERNMAVQLHRQWETRVYKSKPEGGKERQSGAKFISNHIPNTGRETLIPEY